jgi:hypothetical protein
METGLEAREREGSQGALPMARFEAYIRFATGRESSRHRTDYPGAGGARLSKQMLETYSHIRNHAKVTAIAALESDTLALEASETGSGSAQKPAH